MIGEPILVGLVGRAGAGKDTVARLLEPYGYVRAAFADALRAAAYESNPLIAEGVYGVARLQSLVDTHGWDTAKRDFPDVRAYLQDLGVAMRHQIPGCWVDVVADRIEWAHARGEHVVITDVRFADEVQMIRDRGGVIVKVAGRHDPAVDQSHESEQNVAHLDCSITLDNSHDLERLRDAVSFLHTALRFRAIT